MRSVGERDVIGYEDDLDDISCYFGEVTLFGDLKVVEVTLICHGDDEDVSGARGYGLENGLHVVDERGDEDVTSDGGGQHASTDVAGFHWLVAHASTRQDGHARDVGVGGQGGALTATSWTVDGSIRVRLAASRSRP